MHHPTAEWLAQQMVEAFPWGTAPSCLVRDNDGAYGQSFKDRVRAMGIRDRPISPRSPWQNPYVERLIGTLRRDCWIPVVAHGDVLGSTRLAKRRQYGYDDGLAYYGPTCTVVPCDLGHHDMAMMLPTTAPMILTFHNVHAGNRSLARNGSSGKRARRYGNGSLSRTGARPFNTISIGSVAFWIRCQ